MSRTTMYGWKIMVDTNVIFSFIHSKSKKITAIIQYILDYHHLLMPAYVVRELNERNYSPAPL